MVYVCDMCERPKTKVHFWYEMLIFIRPHGDIEETVHINLDLEK